MPLLLLLLAGCPYAGDPVQLPADLSTATRVACVQPIPAWSNDSEAIVTVNQQELLVEGTVLDAGTGDPPWPCVVDGGWGLWDGEVDTWVVLREGNGDQWVVGLQPDLPLTLPAPESALTVRYRVNFPAGRDEVPRGYLQLDDDAGMLLWAGRHLFPASARPPNPFTWSDGDDATPHRAPGCGDWVERSMRVGFDGGFALLERDESAFPPGLVITSGGNARIAQSSAWSCPDELGGFGAEVWIQRNTIE